MTPQTVETTVHYTPALALEIAFACQRFQDTEAVYNQEQTIHNECEYFNASMNLVKPEWYAALLRYIDELEGQQARKGRGK